jgi:hypothetical protein
MEAVTSVNADRAFAVITLPLIRFANSSPVKVDAAVDCNQMTKEMCQLASRT